MADKAKERYFKLLYCDQPGLGVARFPGSEPLSLPRAGPVEGWTAPILELVDGDFADYLASDEPCRLCSERLRRLLDAGATATDELQWLEATVRNQTQQRRYYLLHFPQPPEVLHKGQTVCVVDFVVKPVLARSAARGHGVFTYPGNEGLPLFVAEEVKQAIEAAGCTGLEIASAPTV